MSEWVWLRLHPEPAHRGSAAAVAGNHGEHGCGLPEHLPAVLPVIAFTVLNSHIAMAMEGAVFYTDEGMRIAFLIGAAAAVLGAIAAVFLPRNIVQIGAEDGVQQETSLLPAH